MLVGKLHICYGWRKSCTGIMSHMCIAPVTDETFVPSNVCAWVLRVGIYSRLVRVMFCPGSCGLLVGVSCHLSPSCAASVCKTLHVVCTQKTTRLRTHTFAYTRGRIQVCVHSCLYARMLEFVRAHIFCLARACLQVHVHRQVCSTHTHSCILTHECVHARMSVRKHMCTQAARRVTQLVFFFFF